MDIVSKNLFRIRIQYSNGEEQCNIFKKFADLTF